MESLVMNYSEEEDVFPSEDGAESNHFISRTPYSDDDAKQENIMEIPDRQMKILRTFGFPVVARSPCDLKVATNNIIGSSINEIEDDDNNEVVSDEDDSKDVISSIIISGVATVVNDQDYYKSSAKAALPISSSSNREYHNGSPISNKADEENDGETPTAATFPISCSSLVEQEVDFETTIDLDKCDNYSIILSPKSEREDEEGDKKNSTAARSPISCSFLVGQRANTATAIDLDSNTNHNVSLIKDEEDEQSAKETPAAANFPFSSSSLVGHEADLETSIDLDKCENFSIYSPKSEREDEESDKKNSTAATMPISCSFLVGKRANTATAIDLDISTSHNVTLMKGEEYEKSDKEIPAATSLPISSSSLAGQRVNRAMAIDLDSSITYNVSLLKAEDGEQIDKVNSTAVISRISSTPLVGYEADMEAVVDSYDRGNHSVTPVSNDKEDEKRDKENSTAVLKNPVDSTDEPSESQGERSRRFEANGCDTSTNSQPVISDRRTFQCKLCSYSSTIRFGLKRHMATHSEDSDLNKIKCEFCPFKAKSKKLLSNHLLVRHKYGKSKCTICDTFVPAHLKEKHLLTCKTKKRIFQCKECQYKTIYERMFVRHQIECTKKRRSIPRKSEASGDQCGKLERSKQRGEINEPFKQRHCCEYCSYSTKKKSQFKKHIVAHTISNRPIYPCSECDYKSTKQSLTHHMMLVHKTKFEYAHLSAEKQQLKSCNFCSFTTKYEYSLQTHLLLHTVHNRPIYPCPKCDFKSTKQSLTRHLKVVHKTKFDDASISTEAQQLKSCNFCSYTTKYCHHLKKHRELHTLRNKPIISCTKCDYKAPRYNLFRHSKNVHGSQKGNPRKLTTEYCKFCSFSTHDKRNLRDHTRLHTIHNRPVYRCPKCDYKSTKLTFGKHLKTAHKIESKDISSLAKTKIFQKCDFCSYTTEYCHHLKKHRELHTSGNKPIICCTKCHHKAPRVALFYHYKTVHRSQKDNPTQLTKTEYTCKFCSFTTKDKRNLRVHTVHNSPVYRCPKCDYKSTKRPFFRHLKIAHKIKSKEFSSLAKTTRLMKCNFCSYTTEYCHHLKKHRELHTSGNKPIISCTKCDYKAFNLFHHYKNVHGSQKDNPDQLTKTEYTCKFCSFTTHDTRSLRVHTRSHCII